jgi:hypothetical protein
MTPELPREISPPPDLEDRTVAALSQAHLLRAPTPTWRARWTPLAAAVVLFAAGAMTGAMWSGAGANVAPGQPRFLLLLHDGSNVSPEEEARVVDEYRAWARRIQREGRFVTGERLGSQAFAVPGGAIAGDPVQGYFVVSGADLSDAVSVAQVSPHVARGGRIVVRPIDTPP